MMPISKKLMYQTIITMAEYFAYCSDSDEEYQQEKYEIECMKNYPITWEADKETVWNFAGHGVTICTKSQMASQHKPVSLIHKRVLTTSSTYTFPEVITSCSIKKAKKGKKAKKAKID